MSDFTPPTRDDQSASTDGTVTNADTNRDGSLTALDARLAALERAVTDGETAPHDLDDAAGLEARLDDLDSRVASLETRLDDVDAAVQSLRGYVGTVRAVNREVERRADAALAAVDGLDDDVTDLDIPDPQESSTGEQGAGPRPDGRPTESRSADETDDTEHRDTDLADRVRDLL